jgi:hypothetical protein
MGCCPSLPRSGEFVDTPDQQGKGCQTGELTGSRAAVPNTRCGGGLATTAAVKVSSKTILASSSR